jgi:hypothetical protein
MIFFRTGNFLDLVRDLSDDKLATVLYLEP